MIETNNIDTKPLQLYDIKTDDIVEKNLPQFIDFFEEHPDNMLDTPTIAGYSVDENKPKVFADDYEITSDIIARKEFSANNKINGTENYAVAFLKRYTRWLKSERTRQSKIINTVDKTIRLVRNRRNRDAVDTLLFPINTYTKWLIDHLDVINGNDFEEMTLLNHNEKSYYLDLVLLKLKDCPQIKSSTVNSIARELEQRSDYSKKSSLIDFEIAKSLYHIVNHDSSTTLVYDDEPITVCRTLAQILVNLLHERNLTFPFGALGGNVNYWSFDEDQGVITFKLYSDQDILGIIQGFTNPWAGRLSIYLLKKVLKEDSIRIDLNHHEHLIDEKIKQLQPFASIPTFSNMIESLQLILNQCK